MQTSSRHHQAWLFTIALEFVLVVEASLAAWSFWDDHERIIRSFYLAIALLNLVSAGLLTFYFKRKPDSLTPIWALDLVMLILPLLCWGALALNFQDIPVAAIWFGIASLLCLGYVVNIFGHLRRSLWRGESSKAAGAIPAAFAIFVLYSLPMGLFWLVANGLKSIRLPG